MIAKNDEHKRSVLWRIAISVSSILIVLIAAFFFVKLFTTNPMEGTWAHEDSDLTIQVKNNGTATISWPEKFEDESVVLKMQYTINMDAKIFALHKDAEEIKAVVKEHKGKVTTEHVEAVLSSLDGSYDYNIEQNQLTLTEREYGEQMIFDKK